MSQSIIPLDAFRQLPEEVAKIAASIVIAIVKQLWFYFWPVIIAFLFIIISGIILQSLMLRSGGHSRLSSGFNRLAGSTVYSVFLILITAVAYQILGSEVIDESWIALFGLISFPLTGLFLRAIGFWYY